MLELYCSRGVLQNSIWQTKELEFAHPFPVDVAPSREKLSNMTQSHAPGDFSHHGKAGTSFAPRAHPDNDVCHITRAALAGVNGQELTRLGRDEVVEACSQGSTAHAADADFS